MPRNPTWRMGMSRYAEGHVGNGGRPPKATLSVRRMRLLTDAERRNHDLDCAERLRAERLESERIEQERLDAMWAKIEAEREKNLKK